MQFTNLETQKNISQEETEHRKKAAMHFEEADIRSKAKRCG